MIAMAGLLLAALMIIGQTVVDDEAERLTKTAEEIAAEEAAVEEVRARYRVPDKTAMRHGDRRKH